MAVWVKRYCAECRAPLADWQTDEGRLGQPFQTCKACGTDNDRSKSTTEWDLKSDTQKFIMVAANVISAVVFGLGLPFMIAAFLAGGDHALSAVTVGLTMVGCVLLFLLRVRNGLRRAISESRARMRKEPYRYNLVLLGYMPLPEDLKEENLEEFRAIRGIFREQQWKAYQRRKHAR